MKKINKAFTLVELIVVITILAILGTIAYVAFTGYQADARDTKRASDLDSINKTVTLGFADGVSIMSYISGSGANIRYDGGGAISIAGFTGSTNLNGYYQAGDLNYTVLGLKQSDFQDPLMKVPYKMGATTFGNQYEIAGTLENDGTNTTIVVGSWNSRSSKTSSGARDYIDNDTFYLSGTTTNLTGLRIGDNVQIGSGASSNYTIKMMRDTYIKVDRTITTPGSNIILNNDESSHLIRGYISSGTIIKTLTENNPYDSKYLPYKLN